MTSERERAVALAAEGLGPTEIGRRLGRSKQTVWDWLNRVELVCNDCGEARLASKRHDLCLRCAQERRRERWPEIARLWGEGRTIKEIAEHCDTSASAIGRRMVQMRRQGWDLPCRYRMENGKRVAR